MKSLLITSLILFPLLLSHAETIVPGGNVSGNWPLSGSPYIVRGEILISAGDTLTIEPGVQVRFTGNYKFRIQGLLLAQGTETDTILFTRHFLTENSCWWGLRFESADTTSILEYCRIEWVKSTGGATFRGGGVYIIGTMNVRHCSLIHNRVYDAYSSSGEGGGIGFYDLSTGIVEFCHIANNYAGTGGGISIGQWCRVNIHDNLIENNSSSGAGGIIVMWSTQALIDNNIIRNNFVGGTWGGGGIELATTWATTVSNNLIVNNSARNFGGGFYISYHQNVVPYLFNNIIAGNRAAYGGGIYAENFSYDPAPIVANCIIYNNAAHNGLQIYLSPGIGSHINLTYCDVQGGWPGTGNIDADPLFVRGPGGPYYLSQVAAGQSITSPCVDAGDPASLMITGATRTDGVQDSGIVDMGYHYPVAGSWLLAESEESFPPQAVGHPAEESPPLERGEGGDQIAASPNPFNPTTTIRYQLASPASVHLTVHDVQGRLVTTLVDGQQNAGLHQAAFDGSGLPSGIYLLRLSAGKETGVRKIVLLK